MRTIYWFNCSAVKVNKPAFFHYLDPNHRKKVPDFQTFILLFTPAFFQYPTVAKNTFSKNQNRIFTYLKRFQLKPTVILKS